MSSTMPSSMPQSISQSPKKEPLITRDIAFIMAATFFFMMSNMMATPIIAGYSQSLGASGFLMGIVAGVMSFVALFCRPIAGNLADKTSKRRLAFIGTALYVLADAGYILSQNTGMLMASRIINGIGFACCSVCLASWMSMLLPISRMGAGMGLYGMMNALAQAFGPDLGIRAQKSLGYHMTFVIAMVLAFLMVISVLLVKDAGKPLAKKIVPQNSTHANTTADATTATSTPAKRKFRIDSLIEPRVVPIAMIFMLFGIPYFANQSFIVEYANARQLTLSVSLFFPFYAIALLIMRLTLRNWFDTKSFWFFMIVCTISQLGMLVGLTYMSNIWVLLAAGILTAGGYGLMSSVTQAKAVIIAGKARSGMANTTYYIGIDLGMCLGPIIGGALYGSVPIMWFYPLFMLTMPLAWLIYLPFRKRIDAAKPQLVPVTKQIEEEDLEDMSLR